jgi:hypothetical protein
MSSLEDEEREKKTIARIQDKGQTCVTPPSCLYRVAMVCTG